MKFEINVKNNEKLQKLALVKKIAHVLGMNMLAAKVSIVDKIFELFKDGVESTSFVVDSEITEMKPLFSIKKNMSLFQDEELGITIKLVKDPKELNLCELLKNCIGISFYMPHFGEVICGGVIKYDRKQDAICFRTNENGMSYDWPVKANGKSLHGNSNEICVFPSKEQRDWSLFVPPWIPKKGERVWVKFRGDAWYGRYFDRIENGKFFCYRNQKDNGESTSWDECMPFEPIPW